MTTTAVTAIEERIASDLAQFDPVEAQIAKLREEYDGLKINGPDDKDGRKMVHAAWQVVRDVRLSAEKLHKELKADALKYTQALDARKRQVVEAVNPMEEQFYADWKGFDTAIENRKKEEAERAERERLAKLEERKRAMYAVGLAFNGSHYASKYATVEVVTTAMLEHGTDEQFDEALSKVALQVADARAAEERAEAARVEADRLAKEEAERLRKVAEEQAQREAELKAREESMQRKVAEARINEAMSIGARPGDIPAQVHELSDEQWSDAIDVIRDIVQDRKEAEAKRIAEEEAARKEREERIAAEAAQRERERIEREAQQAKEAEEERIRRAGDVGQFEAMIQRLSDMAWPKDMQSAIAQQSMDLARKHVASAIAVLNGTLTKDLR